MNTPELTLSDLKRRIDDIEEKYIDPPVSTSDDTLAHYHHDLRELIGICRGLTAGLVALSRPICIVSGK